ncbi:Universal stress protein family protein [Chitinophaga jiangningensis]|uniref:Universal stress protein family protein n=1 Tax=Chitinophaga jiangningensis TaxID=1419482 RepID=A0A1M7C1P3_9BACT|nr:universal stress protein [Chitinophaga jiangningensis]SHL61150.1 Universal stress protein family protein [Chitinophaga jiangningensis]
MEKILFITDAMSLNYQALDFAAFLCNLTHSKLTAIFLENLEYEERPPSALKSKAAESGATAQVDTHELKSQCCEMNIKHFKEACERRGINSAIHRDRGVPLQEIIQESRYADLVLIDAETSFANQRESVPTKLVKDVLLDAECPVMISPVSFEGIEQVIFTYDGSPSAIFAIKQFTYLFPELKQQPIQVFTVNNGKESDHKDVSNMKEWMNNHYSSVNFVKRKGNTNAELLEFLLTSKNSLIVMGAYGRSTLSNLFKPSHATSVLRLISQPVFIAHL